MLKASYTHQPSKDGQRHRAEHRFEFRLRLDETKPTQPLVREFYETIAQAETFCVQTFGRQVGKRVKNWEIKGDTFVIDCPKHAFVFRLRWC